MKTTQVMKLNMGGEAFVCTFTPGRSNPYRLYRTWYDNGNHRKMVAQYANFESVLFRLAYLGLPEFKRDTF